MNKIYSYVKDLTYSIYISITLLYKYKYTQN